MYSRNNYFEVDKYISLGGIDNKTNLPTKDINIIDLKTNTVTKYAELSQAIASPKAYSITVPKKEYSSLNFAYLLIDKGLNRIELIDCNDYKISETILIPKELQNYKITGSFLASMDVYIIFENKINTYITKYNKNNKSIEIVGNYNSHCYSPSYFDISQRNSPVHEILFSGGLNLLNAKQNSKNKFGENYSTCAEIGVIEIEKEK